MPDPTDPRAVADDGITEMRIAINREPLDPSLAAEIASEVTQFLDDAAQADHDAALTPPPAAPTQPTETTNVQKLHEMDMGDGRVLTSETPIPQPAAPTDILPSGMTKEEHRVKIIAENERLIADNIRLRAKLSAPTDNTALDEMVSRIIRDNLSGPIFDEPDIQADHQRDIQNTASLIVAALASREAPPAAQEPVGWLYERRGFEPGVSKRKPEYADLVNLQPLYTAPSPACQQEAVKEIAEAKEILSKIGAYAGSRIVIAIGQIDAALRALKGESDNG